MPSGYQANVVAGAPIASTWGNTIRDRSVMVFDTVAQRDTQLPTPTRGMVCYILATAQALFYDGTAWRPPWNLAWGQIAYAEITANSTAIVGPGSVPGMSFTLQHVAGRRVRFSIFANVSVSAIGEARIELLQAGARLSWATAYVYAADRNMFVKIERVITSDSASAVYSTQMSRSAGTGNVYVVAAAQYPAFIMAEDIGPAPGALPT